MADDGSDEGSAGETLPSIRRPSNIYHQPWSSSSLAQIHKSSTVIIRRAVPSPKLHGPHCLESPQTRPGPAHYPPKRAGKWAFIGSPGPGTWHSTSSPSSEVTTTIATTTLGFEARSTTTNRRRGARKEGDASGSGRERHGGLLRHDPVRPRGPRRRRRRVRQAGERGLAGRRRRLRRRAPPRRRPQHLGLRGRPLRLPLRHRPPDRSFPTALTVTVTLLLFCILPFLACSFCSGISPKFLHFYSIKQEIYVCVGLKLELEEPYLNL